jgi:AcrR family transcriptional regulator
VTEDRKETLLGIGERLFSERGYRDLPVAVIAEEAGLGTASFYTYFPSKEAFYKKVVERLESRATRELVRVIEGLQSPLNKLKALLGYIRRDVYGNPILRGIYSGQRRFLYPGFEERAAGGRTLISSIEKILDTVLEEGARKGAFRVNVFKNPRKMLMAIVSTIIHSRDDEANENLISDISMLVERGIKRWLRLRMRDERLDRRATRSR